MTAGSAGLPRASAAELRAARRLRQRKFRVELRQLIAEGRQAVREAIAFGTEVRVLVADDAASEHADLLDAARAASLPVAVAGRRDLDALCDTVTPQGIVAICRALDVPLTQALAGRPRLVVVCAQIRDPGNAGTVIRCADAFGADAVVLTTDSVDLGNPKLVRASVGSVFHLPLAVGVDLGDAIDACRARGLQVLAADGDGESLAATDLSSPTAWVMGNEAWGLPPEHRALADRAISIPMYGRAESLNLSTAAAVCLYATAAAQRG